MLAFLQFETMACSRCSPAVGRPSVRKITYDGRSFAFNMPIAVRRAPSMFVLPPAAIRSTKLSASFSVASSRRCSSGLNDATLDSKVTMLKVSLALRFFRMKRSDFLACSIFFPVMLPDLSSTRTTDLGKIAVSAVSIRGLASSMK